MTQTERRIVNQEMVMELQNAEVTHRAEERERVARELRWGRLRSHRDGRVPLRTIRVALGRRLVAAGRALLDGAGVAVAASR